MPTRTIDSMFMNSELYTSIIISLVHEPGRDCVTFPRR